MARGTSFVVGELARRSSLAGADVTVSMTALKANRSRAEARYTVEVKFSDQDVMGFVAIEPTRPALCHRRCKRL